MKTTRQFFFFFILSGTHGASRRISGDPVPVRKRVVRLLLQAVTSECLRKRGKKRERAREGGREGGSEWGWEREAAAAVWKNSKVAPSSLSQEGFGSGGDAAESWHLVCPSPAAPSGGVLSRFYWDNPTANLFTGLHQALLIYPKGLCSAASPTSSTFVFVILFFTRKKKKKTFPELSQVIFGFLSELPEVNKGFKSLTHAGNGEV